MGIQGLLPVLKDITNRSHIKHFAGKRAAIDGYGWLYKGAYSCAKELCEDSPTDKCAPNSSALRRRATVSHACLPQGRTDPRSEALCVYRYVKFCMSRIRLLLHHGVIPIVVFDGDKLPAKNFTEMARQRCAESLNFHVCHDCQFVAQRA